MVYMNYMVYIHVSYASEHSSPTCTTCNANLVQTMNDGMLQHNNPATYMYNEAGLIPTQNVCSVQFQQLAVIYL